MILHSELPSTDDRHFSRDLSWFDQYLSSGFRVYGAERNLFRKAVKDAAEWVVIRKAEQIKEKAQKEREEKEAREKEEKEAAEKAKEEKEAAEKEKAEEKPKVNGVKADE